MTIPPQFSPRRVGRMARWQRRATYWLLALCALSGLAWWLGMDLLAWPAPQLRGFWVLHGITGLSAALAIGAAVPQHALMSWRVGRNRRLGLLLAGLLAAILATVLALQYGLEQWHDAGHWLHVAVGITAVAVFPLHIWWARWRSAVAQRRRS